MNESEIIEYLARQHSKFGRPKRHEEIDKSIPYFEIFKTGTGRYDVRGYAYENHDNALRMMYWEHVLKNRVLPHIRENISGFYNIELHDSYTYLDNDKKYDGVLTFSKFKHDDGPVLIPDPYALQNWGGMLNQINDPLQFNQKINKVCFYGTTTGNRDPRLNERIQMCLWSLTKPNLYDFKITNIAQMHENDVREACGNNFNNIISKNVSPYEQMKYKFHLVLDGNTCRYDIWNYFTNSVTLKYESKEMLWYYPLLIDGQHYIEVNKDTIDKRMDVADEDANYIINSAKRIARIIQKPSSHMLYLGKVFENMVFNGK